MSRKLFSIISSLILIFNVFGLIPQSVFSPSSISFNVVDLEPTWTTGLLGVRGGLAKIQVADFNQDGVVDIATCRGGHVYVLNQTNPEEYEAIWYSQFLACHVIAIGDRDSNGIMELYIATTDAHVIIIESDDFSVISKITVSNMAYDIAVGDVDGDSGQEIVITSPNATSIYNAMTYNLEWQALGYGGNHLEIGNIDNDPLLEIVVNNNPVYVLNASQKKLKWDYYFGYDQQTNLSLGDVDGDGRSEIAVIVAAVDVYLLEGETQALKWERQGDIGYIRIPFIADVNGDGLGELIIGPSQHGNIIGLQGSTGSNLWSIPSSSYSVGEISAGDVNGDGISEIIWGADESNISGGLLIGSWVTQTILWCTESLDGISSVTSGDIDLDGQLEIVIAYSSTESGYNGGFIRVFDGATHHTEWSTVISDTHDVIHQMVIGQLDLDPAMEILVGGDNWQGTRLTSYDGITHAVEWQSPIMGPEGPLALLVKDVDEDSIDEIIVALSTKNVQVLDGASDIILWDSGSLVNGIIDLSIGDLDGNGNLDLAILVYDHMFVYEVNTWTQTYSAPATGGVQLAISNPDISGLGELLLATSDGTNCTLQSLDGKSFIPIFHQALGMMVLLDLTVADIDNDQYNEFIFMGYPGHDDIQAFINPSVFKIGTRKYPFFWKYQMDASWGAIKSISISDLDNDGQSELLLGSDNLIQVNELIQSERVIQQTFLSVISKPRGIYGTVTDKGVPATNVSLVLRFYDGSSWSTLSQTTTNADGSYFFIGVPSLGPGQAYYVLYQNTPNGNVNQLWTWHTKSITSFTAGHDVHLSDFDLANIVLTTPYNSTSVTLPETFYWVPRTNTPSDSYEFNLYDPYDGDPYFWTDPPLGYVTSFTMSHLPPGFKTGSIYVWEVWVYAPDGGFGISYDAHSVYFNNAGPSVAAAAQPLRPKIVSDLDILHGR